MMNDDDVGKKFFEVFDSSESDVEDEEEDVEVAGMVTPAIGGSRKRVLSKQLSMRETSREAKWEHRRQQIINRRMMTMADGGLDEEHKTIDEDEEERKKRGRVRSLTDEDLDELRGSIELGFGFNEEDGGYNLCDTLPALDLYFAVNRQLSDPKMKFPPSPASTPTSDTSSSTVCGCGTPSPQDDHWKICNPGDSPQHVKTRLRHWAQAVACSVRQCC